MLLSALCYCCIVGANLVHSESNVTTTTTSGDIYTDADVPDATVRYSPIRGLSIQIPARPWFSIVKINGYLNRSKDPYPIRMPPLPKMIEEKLTKPNKNGEWVTKEIKYELDNGDTGYLNIVVYTADDYAYLNEGQIFKVVKLPNGLWTTVNLFAEKRLRGLFCKSENKIKSSSADAFLIPRRKCADDCHGTVAVDYYLAYKKIVPSVERFLILDKKNASHFD